jgi:N-acetylmuramoyl-L-alanine amidase
MPTNHVIRSGEGVSKVAYENGLFPDTVWDDPNNADLRTLRKDPNTLVPGDVLFLIDKRPKVETAPTGTTTRFVIRTVPAVLRLQLAVGDALLADQSYVLTVDGEARNGRTNRDGVLEEYVSPRAHMAILTTAGLAEPMSILIGGVGPVDTLPGVKTRLNNLGFFCGEPTQAADEATQAAVRAFEEDVGLTPTGDWTNPEFQDRLASVHDTTESAPPDATPPEPAQ